MKGIVDSASELIGKTPMLYLHNYMKEAGVEDAAIIAKLEYFNPAGSVKDRVALAMIEDAKMIGITPLMLTLTGMWELCPPYIFLPTTLFAY